MRAPALGVLSLLLGACAGSVGGASTDLFEDAAAGSGDGRDASALSADASGAPDAGARPDAGEPADASLRDASEPRDAAAADAHALADAGEPADAGRRDGGERPDAGAADASALGDAGGAGSDAGVDAGPADSGIAERCGDGTCDPGESCALCPADCGACPAAADCRRAGSLSSGRVFQVGPARTYKTIDAVQGLLGPGDRVEVDGDATYPALDLTSAGTATAPIVFAGIAVNGRRPVLQGGDNTVHFDGSHHVVFQGFEIAGGAQRCVFHHADDVTLCQSVVRDCLRHGILGADFDSGSLLVDRVEVLRCGGQYPGENTKHPIYVATDPVAFPEAVFRVQHSFVHDNNSGNCIKSRSLRTEVYGNWLEASAAQYYTLELVGFEEFSEPRQDSEVVGNVLVHLGGYGVRLGGDGTGDSKGRVRFDYNTVIQTAMDASTPVIRFFGVIESFEASDNVFYRLGGGPLRLTRNDADWVGGSMHTAGHHNWVPAGSTELPSGWAQTLFGASSSAQPGFAEVSSFSTLDLDVVPGAAIRQAGAVVTNGPTGFEIARPLLNPATQPPARRPAGFWTVPESRPAEGAPTLGARACPTVAPKATESSSKAACLESATPRG